MSTEIVTRSLGRRNQSTEIRRGDNSEYQEEDNRNAALPNGDNPEISTNNQRTQIELEEILQRNTTRMQMKKYSSNMTETENVIQIYRTITQEPVITKEVILQAPKKRH